MLAISFFSLSLQLRACKIIWLTFPMPLFFPQSLLLQNIKALPGDAAVKQEATNPKTKPSRGSQSSLLDIHDDADDDSCLPLSPDGKYLILSPTSDDSPSDEASLPAGNAGAQGGDDESNA